MPSISNSIRSFPRRRGRENSPSGSFTRPRRRNIRMNILKLFNRRRPSRKEALAPERFEIALSGSGGQGIVLAGKILAEAASIYDGKEAVMTQSYGPEARGGASKTEVIISSVHIDYPKVIDMNV